MTRRFKYALEPLRLQRSWAQSDLQMQLAEHNAKVEEQDQEVRDLEGQAEAALQDWRVLALPARSFQPGTLAVYSGYLGWLDGRIQQARAVRAELEQERERIADTLAQVMRELDAVERHKMGRRAEFDVAERKAAGVEADDHWSILRNRSMHAG